MKITSSPHSLCIDIIILGLELFEANLRLLPVNLEVHLRLLDVVREHLDQSEMSLVVTSCQPITAHLVEILAVHHGHHQHEEARHDQGVEHD